MSARRCAALLAVAALAGCGGHARRPPATGAGAVVRAWAADERAGDFAAAARRFAIPATVANGGPALTLHTLAEAEFFNRTLPCGAVVTAVRPAAGGRIVATFRLTERAGPGAGCGSGDGQPAAVRFRIVGGRIAEWVRVADPVAPSGTPT